MGTYGNTQSGFQNSTLTQEKTSPIEIVVSKQSRTPRKTHNSRGIPTSVATDSIRSYNDVLLLKNYFLEERQSPRDWMLFILGCATGLRISDLVNLKWSDLLHDDRSTFKTSINICEIKTGKSTVNLDDEVYITEAAQVAISLYLNSIYWIFSLDDFVFKSQKPTLSGEYVLTPESCHRIFKKAQRDLNLPINMGSHTMRKTFLTLSFHIALRSPLIREISQAMGIAQMLARHSDVKTTMRYLKENKNMLRAIRCAVSDFLLGKSDITTLDIDYMGSEVF